MASKDFPRSRRVAELLQRELAQLIRAGVTDPDLGMVTVSGVEVARDLGHARVYVTAIQEQNADRVVSALNKAAGCLRHQLAQRTSLRRVPMLRFVFDHSVEQGSRVSALIDAAVAADTVKARAKK